MLQVRFCAREASSVVQAPRLSTCRSQACAAQLCGPHLAVCVLHLGKMTAGRSFVRLPSQASRCRVSRMWALSGSCVSALTAVACCLHGTSSEQRSPGCITRNALLYRVSVDWLRRLLLHKTADVAH